MAAMGFGGFGTTKVSETKREQAWNGFDELTDLLLLPHLLAESQSRGQCIWGCQCEKRAHMEAVHEPQGRFQSSTGCAQEVAKAARFELRLTIYRIY